MLNTMNSTNIATREPLPFKALLATFACSIAATNCAIGQTRLHRLTPELTASEFGASVAIAGDLNGDGFDDLVVGAPASQPSGGGAGAVEVFSGATGDQLYYFPGRLQGPAVAPAGDVNGDGYADIICGAPDSSEFTQGGGAVFVYSGFDGQILHQWHGAANQSMGAQVAGGGDLDADGFDDLIVSYGSIGISFGASRAFSGATGARMFYYPGFAGNSWTGSPVSIAGDINGDGHDDVIMGGDHSGHANVFSGADGALLYSLSGAQPFGDSVGGLGDINNDGFDDFVVGEPSSSGHAYAYSGQNGQVLYSFEGDVLGGEFGSAVCGAGDVDGDGIPDIAVSAPGRGISNGEKGYLRVYSGADGSVLYMVLGTFSFRNFGRSISGGGDINGDGLADLIAGGHLDQIRGRAYVYTRSIDGPTTICAGQTNSTGRGARMIALSPSGFDAGANDTTIRVTGLPNGTPSLSMIINSPAYGRLSSTMPGGMLSDGLLCIAGGPIGRFNRPGELFFGSSGWFERQVDLNNIPWTDPASTPAYSTVLQAGESWCFQCWYRDETSNSNPLVVGENSFSDAIRITFR